MRSLLILAALIAIPYAVVEYFYWPSSHIRAVSVPYTWSAVERAEISRADCEAKYPNPHWLKLPLDPSKPEGETFEMFYFINGDFDPKKPVILQMSGGPGGVPEPHASLPPQPEGGSVVHFHMRGSGCSQIPAANSYDRYLRMASIVSDAEALRVSLGIEQWQVLYGASGGAILAQMYAHRFPERVRRVFLNAAYAPTPANGRENSTLQKMIWKVIARYRTSAFLQISDADLNLMLVRFSDDLADLNDFGSTSFIGENSANFSPEAQARHPGLRHGPEFIEALNNFRYDGWAAATAGMERELYFSSVAIVNAYFPEKLSFAEVSRALAYLRSEVTVRAGERGSLPTLSLRVFQATMAYDGLSHSLWRLARQTSPLDLNRYALSVGGSDDLPTSPYEPKASRHSVPTIVLHGTADLTSPLSGAHLTFDTGLQGPKFLIMVSGGGHGRTLPLPCMSQLFAQTMAATSEWKKLPELFARGQACFYETGVAFESANL